jgi:hypothetical protein
MGLPAMRVQFACHWRPLGMRLDAKRMQILHALAVSCVQSRQLFASTLREQLQYLNLKNEDTIKKWVTRDICAC